MGGNTEMTLDQEDADMFQGQQGEQQKEGQQGEQQKEEGQLGESGAGDVNMDELFQNLDPDLLSSILGNTVVAPSSDAAPSSQAAALTKAQVQCVLDGAISLAAEQPPDQHREQQQYRLDHRGCGVHARLWRPVARVSTLSFCLVHHHRRQQRYRARNCSLSSGRSTLHSTRRSRHSSTHVSSTSRGRFRQPKKKGGTGGRGAKNGAEQNKNKMSQNKPPEHKKTRRRSTTTTRRDAASAAGAAGRGALLCY